MIRLQLTVPIGTHKSLAFVDRRAPDGEGLVGGVEEVELPVYPPEAVAAGEVLRRARQELRLGLRAGADALGITVVELCQLERGAATVPDLDRQAIVARWRSQARKEG